MHEDKRQGKIDANTHLVNLEFAIVRAKQQAKFDVRAGCAAAAARVARVALRVACA